MNPGTRITSAAYGIIVLYTNLRCRREHELLELKVCKLIKVDPRNPSPVHLIVEVVIQRTCYSTAAGINDVISTNMQVCATVFDTLSVLIVAPTDTSSCREGIDLCNHPLVALCHQKAAFRLAKPTFGAFWSMRK